MAGKTVEVRVVSESVGGFVASGFIFVGLTALWAIFVRDDPFYGEATLFGATAPFATAAYLTVIPLLGFLFGRWTYHHVHDGGAVSFSAKLVARAANFTYAHLLILLFTVAMLTDRLMGLNVDDQVRTFDDVLFNTLARFAPWLSAYLAGFNFGRATAVRKTVISVVSADEAVAADTYREINHTDLPSSEKPTSSKAGKPAKKTQEPKPERQSKAEKASRPERGKQTREEPIFETGVFVPSDAAGEDGFSLGGRDDNAAAKKPAAQSQTLSGLPRTPQTLPEGAPAETGFLPPQDFERLRPTLKQLR